MRLKPFDPKAQYLVVLETFKPSFKPGIPSVVAVNFVVEAKLVGGKRTRPEGRIAKHYFVCNEALVPNHPNAKDLMQLVGFKLGASVFPWSRLVDQEFAIRFGKASDPGRHNPVVEIMSTDVSVFKMPAAPDRKHKDFPRLDKMRFKITWR